MRVTIERAFENLVRRKKGALLNALLTPPCFFYKSGVRFRNWAYDRGLFAMKRAPLPIVSIGNIVAGGAGKTSLTMLLAKELSASGTVAVLTSGYRSTRKKRGPVVVSVGKGPEIAWEVAGDEALMLSTQLPEAIVVSGRDRFASAELAWLLGAKVVLLDDGMQHRKLFRDFEVAMINGNDPIGGGHFLPKGRLRDEPARIDEADLVVCVGKIPSYLAHTRKKWVRMERRIKRICGQEGEKISSLSGKKVGLFCGIGDPKSFVELLEQQGATIVATRLLADHRTLSKEELASFAKEVKEKGAEFLVCTEKDWIKLPILLRSMEEPLALVWVESNLEIVENRPNWDWAIDEIKNRIAL